MKLITLWGHTERPWGYEIRAIFRKDGSDTDINECMTFQKKPDEKEISRQLAVIEERLLKVEPEVVQEETIVISKVEYEALQKVKIDYDEALKSGWTKGSEFTIKEVK